MAKKVSFSEEQMRAFCKDAIPVLEKLQEVAKKHAVTEGVSIYMAAEYLSVDGSGLDGWEMNNYGEKYKMRHERAVEVFEEGADTE